MNKLSSPDAEVKQQHPWLSFSLDAATEVADPLLPPLKSSNDIFENSIDLKKSQYHFGVVVTAHAHM